MLTIKKPLSESEALKAAKPLLWRGWFSAKFLESVEKESRRGNPMIEVRLVVFNDEESREFRDWLTGAERGAARLRHACVAVGAVDKYEAGEIGAADFPGHTCRVQVGVEKRRGYPDRNVIEDYAASSVVAVRAVS
jgi:hypothetical protein